MGSGRVGPGRVGTEGIRSITNRFGTGRVGLGYPVRSDPRVLTLPMNSPGYFPLSSPEANFHEPFNLCRNLPALSLE